MSSTNPHARYALRGDAGVTDDLQNQQFDTQVSELWFAAKVDRKLLKSLMKRSDGTSLWNYGLWLGLMLASGIGGYLTWGTLWAIPFFAVYGTLYATSDHRAHELSHGTPFKTRWINEIFYHLAGFMTLHEGHYWRWSHTRHHTHTVVVGKDPEIAVPRPANRLHILLDFFYLRSGFIQIRNICCHAFGHITEAGSHFIPDAERRTVIRSSRVFVLIFALVIAACVWTQSILPAMFIVLPRFYGGILPQLFNVTQHAGLAEDVRDHRMNTRSFATNPVFQWLYANMNFHVEHHMFPMVPYHRLPELHAVLKDQFPTPCPSVWAAWAEFWPVLSHQSQDPSHHLVRPLPVASN